MNALRSAPWLGSWKDCMAAGLVLSGAGAGVIAAFCACVGTTTKSDALSRAAERTRRRRVMRLIVKIITRGQVALITELRRSDFASLLQAIRTRFFTLHEVCRKADFS